MLFTSVFTLIPGKGMWTWSLVPILQPSTRTVKKQSMILLSVPVFHCMCAFEINSLACGGKKPTKTGLAVNILMMFRKKHHLCVYVPCRGNYVYRSKGKLLSVGV